VITQVGAGVRELRHDRRDLVLPYRPDEVRPRYRGAVLAPWPNRIADGRYDFAGRPHQLDINEPERQTALHGLVCWVRFDLVSQTASTVTLRHRLVPQPGYPFLLDISVHYSLDADGLACTVTARNPGASPAPYGTAPHPYLRGGEGPVDDWSLLLPADEVLEVTPDRLLPIKRVPVDGRELDFRVERRIDAVELDHAFTRLRPDSDGLVRARVMQDESTGVECAWDPDVLPWVQVHTADLPDPAESRRGLALEPMTCPPDAFNSGDDLVILEPDTEHSASWTIRAV
jgi:aldose 1-epimerase